MRRLVAFLLLALALVGGGSGALTAFDPLPAAATTGGFVRYFTDWVILWVLVIIGVACLTRFQN